MQDGIAVLTDFDGTVTKADVGNSLTTRYADPNRVEIEEKWRSGKIGSAQSHIRQYSTMNVPEEEIKEYILRMQLDETFLPFLNYLREKEIPLEIVSDGFDFYIEPLLKKYRIQLKYRANTLMYKEKKFSFPYQNGSCWRCANCKVQAVQHYLKQGRRVIYIGDGRSDIYAASISDVIFAKKGETLEKLLQEENIHYIPFQTFGDILSSFQEGLWSYRYAEVSVRRCGFFVTAEE